jgi:hypothetical protein
MTGIKQYVITSSLCDYCVIWLFLHHFAFIPFVFSLFVLVFSLENKAKLSSLRDEKRPHVVRKVVM